MKKHTEARFEDAITLDLVARGFAEGDPKTYDAKLGLFPADVLAWVKASEGKKWKALEDLQGPNAAATLIDSLCKELAIKGALHVLRHGFKCYGKTYAMAAFKPASGLNAETLAAYKRNILTVTRQVPYNPDSKETVDVVLAVNGIPIVTAELKNAMSGQRVADARRQYETDRDTRKALFMFKSGALVHFAVDTDEVAMTTRLEGAGTQWLPFNRGHENGAGNPPVEGGYRTAYLWQDILAPDSLLDLLARFLHLQVSEKQVRISTGVRTVRKEALIFPRYHQIIAVRKLVGHAAENGSGRNYLIQHSAGSGKSNSIAWLAHHLAGLHNASNEKIFDSVVIITDRLVLDQQLQETVFQFEHKRGVVEKIDDNTQQLAKALASRVPIIISTVQKFPFIAQAMQTLAQRGEGVSIDTSNKRFAIIVDEAHSSAAGETAQALRAILNKDGIEAAVAAQLLEDDDDSGMSPEAREALVREMAKRPRQPNLSYFAFTATPKFKTKALFSEPGETGKSPFHLYSMRQAIQEGFILDVLANYTTYKAYYGLLKKRADDPEVPKREASRAIARFLEFHSVNLRQKVEIIVEHFRNFTKHKIGGRAKAMVVTGSRLQAVRYKEAIDKYIRDKGYTDLKALVAFSGEVVDPELQDRKFTEPGMNGFSERELPERFELDEYKVLIVAEKYQTGFDQPLLHTMYVDKRLAGIQAVQTLSRLNRRAAGKTDTFVLDFVNDRDEIFQAFKDYYEQTDMGEMPDVQALYRLQAEIESSTTIDKQDITDFCEIWFRKKRDSSAREHQQMDTILNRAVDRYKALEEDEQDDFKSKLVAFRNLYAFLAQLLPFQDSDLEKLNSYGRFLLTKLPPRTRERYLLDDEVSLKYYRLQKIGEGSINLEGGDAKPLKGPTEVGTGFAEDPQVYLSSLVDLLNDRFGTDFTNADQLFFDQLAETAIEDARIRDAAQANRVENFEHVWKARLDDLMLERLDGNEEIVNRVMNDPKFRETASEQLMRQVYERIRQGKPN